MSDPFQTPFETEPHFVNELGVKWWPDRDTTAYAANKGRLNVSLKAAVWFTEDKSGYRSRVIVVNGDVVYDNQSLEAILAHIDMMKLTVSHIRSERESNDDLYDTDILDRGDM